jgi:tetratricopeptide (TPR) repeat protein
MRLRRTVPGRLPAAAFLVGLMAMLSACASANNAALKQTSAEAGRSLAAGDFQRTIDLLETARAKDPKNRKVTASFARSVEEIWRSANSARAKRNFGQAAAAYRVLANNWARFSAISSMLTFGKADVQAGVKASRVGIIGLQVSQELGAGNYEKALAAGQAGLREFPGDESLMTGCAQVVAEIRSAGAKALTAGDYATAGRADGLLLAQLVTLEKLGLARDIDRNELASAIKTCSSNLTTRGLEEYRKGELEKAISIWQSLLVFEPENAEVRKAVETAKAQLGKLKSGESTGRRGTRP